MTDLEKAKQVCIETRDDFVNTEKDLKTDIQGQQKAVQEEKRILIEMEASLNKLQEELSTARKGINVYEEKISDIDDQIKRKIWDDDIADIKKQFEPFDITLMGYIVDEYGADEDDIKNHIEKLNDLDLGYRSYPDVVAKLGEYQKAHQEEIDKIAREMKMSGKQLYSKSRLTNYIKNFMTVGIVKEYFGVL